MKTKLALVTVLTALIGAVGATVAGIIGYQSGLRSVEKDYVQIAANILSSDIKNERLKGWAVQILDELAPVKLSADLKADLQSGDIAMPEERARPPKNALRPCVPPIVIEGEPVSAVVIAHRAEIARCEARRQALMDAWPR